MGINSFLRNKFGVDKSIAYSSGARIVQAFTGVVSVFFISTILSGVEQGFYYTFGSILALQVFFELGLTGIITQYVAHEVSHLKLDENREYQGSEKYKSRLASLVHFCVKWYTVLAILVFVFLLIAGFVYFNRYGNSHGENVIWKTPWIVISLATAIQLFVSPLTSILTGLGFVKETSKISFFQQCIVPCGTWLGLFCGLKLYVTGIGYFLSILIWFVFIFKLDLARILYNLLKTKVTEQVVYMSEIFPYQWKIALSWVSGYFIFQLFNPVLFATEGAVVAGQMGMTMQALNAMMAFTQSWINTKVPVFSGFIAQKDYVKLDNLFETTKRQMMLIGTFLLIAFILVIATIQHLEIFKNIGERFLPVLPLSLMSWSCWTMFPINCWATYLRCHKKEPLLISSVVIAILCGISTLLLGNMYGLIGIVTGFATIRIISLTWIHHIYITKKLEWHGK